jgi:uncharacterized membrane protein
VTVQRLQRERGAVAPLVAVAMLGLLAITALVVDGGVMFAARRDLQGLADSSARAGAMAIDADQLRQTGTVRLDPDLAEDQARDYLRTAGFQGDVQVRADTSAVTVDLVKDRATVMMGLVGVRTMRTDAHAVARPRTGIETPEG